MPRIYVASLSDYNAGRLHGVWIECSGKDADDIQEEVNEMLKRSSEDIAEEWSIHDYDEFGKIKLGEYESFETVAALANALETHGEAYGLYVENVGQEYASPEDFEDSYQGAFDSEKDFAYHIADECGFEAPDTWPGNCIDWDQATRELFMGDYWSGTDSNYSVHVFRNN